MKGRVAAGVSETVVATEVSGKGVVTQLAAMPIIWVKGKETSLNPLNPVLNPICYLLALLGAHYFLHVIYIYIYIYIERERERERAPIPDVSRSHTTTQHSR